MKSLIAVVGSLVVLSACGPAEAPQEPTLTRRALGEVGNLSVELLSASPLAVGQNRVFYRVLEHGQPATHAELVQKPLMRMMSMQHACPVVKPDHMANADGLFEGLIVFTMPGSAEEPWQLKLEALTSHDSAPQTVDLGQLEIAASKSVAFVTRDGRKLIVSLGYPDAARVGANPVVVTAHEATDAMKMNFATVDDLTFTLVTEMPSMGHGANGNADPTRGEDGLYRGTAVFSMAGEWVVHLGVKVGEQDLGTFDFPISL
jgi:hypothetical protein